jgi:ubiquinone/menaquinone biosynthesis C-methylase UbiE
MIRDSAGNASSVESLYDRIAKLYEISFKFNRYSHSLERYLNTYLPPLPSEARILDAGCGTGLLTAALLKTVNSRADIIGIDLSAKSIEAASESINDHKRYGKQVWFLQADLLRLPFADGSFNLVATSGALEYVPLEDGLAEIARVLVTGGHLIFLPCKPSLISNLLERLFCFRVYPPERVMASTMYHFEILSHHHFPLDEPIGWSKTVILGRKLSR